MEETYCFIFENITVPVIFFERGTEVQYKRNQIIFHPEQLLDGMLIIIEGKIANYSYSPTGNEKIFFVFGKGSTIGEGFCLTDVPNPAYFKALEKVKAIYINKHTLIDIIKLDYQATEFIVTALVTKIRNFCLQTQDVIFFEAESRICHTILQLAKYYGELDQNNSIRINIKISHQFISDILGINRTTTSKIMLCLKQKNAIDICDGYYIVKDPAMLKSISKRKR